MIAKHIGEALLFVVGLPIFAYTTFEGMQALADVFAQMSDFTNFK